MPVYSEQHDMGGLDLIVRDLHVGATKPGQQGTRLDGTIIDTLANLSETEIGFIDGVTAGTVTASKAVVVDSSKNIATFGNITGAILTGTNGVLSGSLTGGVQALSLVLAQLTSLP